MKLNLERLSFQQLYRLQSPENKARFLAPGREFSLNVCRSPEVQKRLIRRARQELPAWQRQHLVTPLAPMPIAVVYQREHQGALNLSDRAMLTKAILIQQWLNFHNMEFHSFREFNHYDPFAHRIEVWAYACPIMARMLDYCLGLSQDTIAIVCRNRLCEPTWVYPHFDFLKTGQRWNPTFAFPSTPDCLKVFQKLLTYCN